MTNPFLIQSRNTLACPNARTLKESRYFSPALAEVRFIGKAMSGTICIDEDRRADFEAGKQVRAIIILDPLAWLWEPEETERAWSREEIGFAVVVKAE